MTRLYLLRHARAKWAAPGGRDYDRALEPSGKADAEAIATSMLLAGYLPDKVLCSGAARARQTWQAVSRHLDIVDITYDDALYNSDAAGYLELIRQHGGAGSLLVIGHNPMMEDLTVALSRSGEANALAAVAHGFPTCALAVIRFPSPLTTIAPRSGFLEDFLVPAELD